MTSHSLLPHRDAGDNSLSVGLRERHRRGTAATAGADEARWECHTQSGSGVTFRASQASSQVHQGMLDNICPGSQVTSDRAGVMKLGEILIDPIVSGKRLQSNWHKSALF